MILAILIVFGIILVCSFVGTIIVFIVGLKNGNGSHSYDYTSGAGEHRTTGFFDDSRKSSRNDYRPYSDPFDNHWETSFDWKDEDNDGYDDRDDGFWNEREF